MLFKFTLSLALILSFGAFGLAQEKAPAELELLKMYAGTWDAAIEVWPQGPDSPSIKFKGVEKNRAYGEYWIASDFDSEFQGQTMSLHSIIGYDMDRKKMVGTNIDQGIYAAKMTGDYDSKSKTVTWKTEAKDLNGKPMVQRTVVTQKNPDERVLVLMVPKTESGEFSRFMQIVFTKRK